jgi:predicted DNA-binding transcriptional regulator AlpA
MAETFTPESLLNTVAAARQLGVSPSFLAKARMQGVGPRYRKLGRAVRYAHSDLDHWLQACGRTSTAEQPGDLLQTIQAPVTTQRRRYTRRIRRNVERRDRRNARIDPAPTR